MKKHVAKNAGLFEKDSQMTRGRMASPEQTIESKRVKAQLVKRISSNLVNSHTAQALIRFRKSNLLAIGGRFADDDEEEALYRVGLWDLKTGKNIKTFGVEGSEYFKLKYFEEKELLIGCSLSLNVWEANHAFSLALSFEYERNLYDVDYIPREDRLIAVGYFSEVLVVNLQTFELEEPLVFKALQGNWITSVKYIRSRDVGVFWLFQLANVAIVNWNTKQVVALVKGKFGSGGDFHHCWGLGFDEARSLIYAPLDNGVVAFWKLDTSSKPISCNLEKKIVNQLGWLYKVEYLPELDAVAVSSYDAYLRIYLYNNPPIMTRIQAFDGSGFGLVYLPRSKQLLGMDDKSGRIAVLALK